MKRNKKSEVGGVCCDENKLTCEVCSFEDSLKVDADDEKNEE